MSCVNRPNGVDKSYPSDGSNRLSADRDRLELLRRVTAVVTAQAAIACAGATAGWLLLAIMGGVESNTTELEATWKAHAFGVILIITTIVSAPAFAVAAVVLWNNAPISHPRSIPSVVAMLWVSVVWCSLFLVSASAAIIADGTAPTLVLAVVTGVVGLMGLACVRTSGPLLR